MTDRRRLLLIALIAFAAAIAGVLIGRAYVVRQTPVKAVETSSSQPPMVWGRPPTNRTQLA